MVLVTNHGGGGKLAWRWLDKEEVAFDGLSNGVDGKTMQLWTKIDIGKEIFSTVLQEQQGPETLNDDEGLVQSLYKPLA